MISAEQWNGIANKLKSHVHSSVKFRLNGHDVMVILARVKECELAYVVTVDGNMPIHWLPESDGFLPVSKKVCRHSIVKPYASTINKIKKERGGKTYLKSKDAAWVHATSERWIPWFKSVKSLVNQYKKIEGLELVSPLSQEVVDAG